MPVYKDAELAGDIILHDGMEPNKPFTVRIQHEGRGRGARICHCRKRRKFTTFDIMKVIMHRPDKTGRPLRKFTAKLDVVIPPREGESRITTTWVYCVNVVTQKPRIMLIDGRPRWEFRYLRNLLSEMIVGKLTLFSVGWEADLISAYEGTGLGGFLYA